MLKKTRKIANPVNIAFLSKFCKSFFSYPSTKVLLPPTKNMPVPIPQFLDRSLVILI